MLNALTRSPGMFHSGLSAGTLSSSVHNWVDSVESVLSVSFGGALDTVPFARLKPVLTVNLDDSAKRFL